MSKYDRNYFLEIETDVPGEFVEITRPISIDFDVIRNTFSQANTAMVRIYNLNPLTRSKLRKDKYSINKLKKIRLAIGYGDQLSSVLSGEVQVAYSERVGSDYITTIQSFDAGKAYATATINRQYSAGTRYDTIMNDLVSSLKNAGVEKGKIGAIEGETKRSASYSGSVIQIAENLSGGNFFIDQGKAFVLALDEAYRSGVPVIRAGTGLLGTPVRDFQNVTINMLLEPGLSIGQLLQLESFSDPTFNSIYKVISLHHSGTISETTSGSVKTTAVLLGGFGQWKELA